MSQFLELDTARIIKTIAKLESRIRERFPDRGLVKVCGELLTVAKESKERVKAISKPDYKLRLLSTALMGLGVAALAFVASIIEYKNSTDNLFGVLEGIDSAFNILVLMGAVAIFLWGLEARHRRQKALEDLHKLRSIIHVIDMHQLTKDPSAKSFMSFANKGDGDTPASPKRTMTSHELTRYLDYCSEMQSLAGKVAALYAQGSGDAVVVETASDLGQVTTNMSAKIWQKIELVHRLEERAQPTPAPGPAVTDKVAPAKHPVDPTSAA